MNLEELKGEWVAHHDKLNHTPPLKPEVIRGIIRKKSKTMVSKINMFYLNGILFCSFYILVFFLLGWWSGDEKLLGDRMTSTTMIALLLGSFVLILAKLRMGKLDYEQTVLNYLEKVVDDYVLATRIVIGLGLLMLGVVLFMLPSGNLSENIAREGLVWGLFDTYMSFIFTLIIVWAVPFIPKKYLWSKEDDVVNPRKVKRELKELRELTAELKEEEL